MITMGRRIRKGTKIKVKKNHPFYECKKLIKNFGFIHQVGEKYKFNISHFEPKENLIFISILSDKSGYTLIMASCYPPLSIPNF